MYSIEQGVESFFEEKKSRFLSFLVPYGDFEATLASLREEHKKAVHFVWAFRTLNAEGQIVEGSTDDGEPSGKSGAPTLRVLQGNDLIETAVITVRYFGGTKLGTGGLVKAYTQSIKEAVSIAEFVPFIRKQEVEFHLTFKDLAYLDYLVGKHAVDVISRTFDAEGAQIALRGSTEALMPVLDLLGQKGLLRA